jgi:glycerate 2-kinase
MNNYRSIAESIFLAGVESVLPDRLIRANVRVEGSILYIIGNSYDLNKYEHLFILGAGKASALMARELEDLLGDRITEGVVVVKYGHACRLNRIRLLESGHPIPDENGRIAADALIELADQAGEKDLVICLLSGGASALLADFPEGSTLEELSLLNSLLLTCGAGIREVNTVRKHFSRIKGGQLAARIYPATLISLILSDVVGDPIDMIASGPTCPDPSTFGDVLQILHQYKLWEELPPYAVRHFEAGGAGLLPETPKPEDPLFTRTHHQIIGNNQLALNAAARRALDLRMSVNILSSTLEGDVRTVADVLLDTVWNIQQDQSIRKPVCLLAGGETTIDVKGTGLGGRNQHFALYVASKLTGRCGITLLCAGTDGTDGPTDAAGAVVDCLTFTDAQRLGMDPEMYLQNYDSYPFFSQAGGQVVTGSTMTNVMDMMVLIIT